MVIKAYYCYPIQDRCFHLSVLESKHAAEEDNRVEQDLFLSRPSPKSASITTIYNYISIILHHQGSRSNTMVAGPCSPYWATLPIDHCVSVPLHDKAEGARCLCCMF